MTAEPRRDWLGWAVDVVGRLSIAAIFVIAATFVWDMIRKSEDGQPCYRHKTVAKSGYCEAARRAIL